MATGTFNTRSKIWTGDVGAYRYPLDVYLGEKLLEALDETPERILQINHEENSKLTCKDAKLSSIRVAQNLQRLSIKPDDVIGFICRNSGNVIPLIFGCLLIGVPVNPLHVSYTKDKIKHMFGLTRPKLVFCDHDLFETTKEALHEIKNNAMIFTLLKKIPVVPYVNELLVPTGSEYHFKPLKFDKRASEKLVAIVCSSETTGPAKGVCMPHTTILQFAHYNCKSIKTFVSLNFSSIYSGTGLIGIYLAPFRTGETRISTIQPFNSELCVKLIEQYRVTVIVLPPVHLNSLLNSPASRTGDFSSLIMFSCTGAVVSESLRSKFKTTFPDKPLLISYGTTEIFIAALCPGQSSEALKVGKTYSNIQVKVIDDEGNPLDLGEVGEVCAKPEFKFQGYYNNPETTQQSIDRDGFLKTGDVGYLDKDGCIYILDRNNDIFKFKDHLITPSEIENIIESIEGVELVSVVGIPDSKATNLPAALIQKRPGFDSLTEHDITSAVAEKLPYPKHLYGGVYFGEIPTSLNGKILRRKVRETLILKHQERYKA
ncbi:CLUMA_CG011355, isoform A [Clunio marinus]|uniref:CLUMA_CG011355, isoform A n=1 Tax=Clunio marinus TaxID=568069 RepID=A0A1J1ICH1_9DIPT|nr:CLUMA_CG011355, isoform A [Clunio marinus]